jgi:hypothetical protein
LPEINHGIVLLEVLERVDLNGQADNLPLQYQGTPITYLSLRDFLKIAVELRTAPEVLAYLAARRGLPYTDLRIIGDERALFEFYLLNGGSLEGCAGKADAAIAVAARSDELDRALKSKWEEDQYNGLREDVADRLATRRQDYAAGLTADALVPRPRDALLPLPYGCGSATGRCRYRKETDFTVADLVERVTRIEHY